MLVVSSAYQDGCLVSCSNIFKKKNAKGPAQDKIKNLVVDITKKEAIPVIADLTIKTNKAPFKGHITIEGIAQRPAFVAAKSAASHISCHFPKHAPGQTVHMVAITYHGKLIDLSHELTIKQPNI